MRGMALEQVLRRLAEEGDAEALFNLGYLCLQGQEVPQNVTAAFILFRMVDLPLPFVKLVSSRPFYLLWDKATMRFVAVLCML